MSRMSEVERIRKAYEAKKRAAEQAGIPTEEPIVPAGSGYAAPATLLANPVFNGETNAFNEGQVSSPSSGENGAEAKPKKEGFFRTLWREFAELSNSPKEESEEEPDAEFNASYQEVVPAQDGGLPDAGSLDSPPAWRIPSDNLQTASQETIYQKVDPQTASQEIISQKADLRSSSQADGQEASPRSDSQKANPQSDGQEASSQSDDQEAGEKPVPNGNVSDWATERKLKEAEAELERAKGELKKTKETLATERQEAAAVKARLKNLEEKAISFASGEQQFAKAKETNAKLELELEQTKAEAARLRQENDKLCSQLAGLQEEDARLRLQNEELQGVLETAKVKREQIASELEEVMKDFSDLKSRTHDAERLREDNAMLRAEAAERQKKLEAQSEQVRVLHQKVTDYRNSSISLKGQRDEAKAKQARLESEFEMYRGNAETQFALMRVALSGAESVAEKLEVENKEIKHTLGDATSVAVAFLSRISDIGLLTEAHFDGLIELLGAVASAGDEESRAEHAEDSGSPDAEAANGEGDIKTIDAEGDTETIDTEGDTEIADADAVNPEGEPDVRKETPEPADNETAEPEISGGWHPDDL